MIRTMQDRECPAARRIESLQEKCTVTALDGQSASLLPGVIWYWREEEKGRTAASTVSKKKSQSRQLTMAGIGKAGALLPTPEYTGTGRGPCLRGRRRAHGHGSCQFHPTGMVWPTRRAGDFVTKPCESELSGILT